MTAGKQKKWHLSQSKKFVQALESFFVVNDQIATIRICAKSLKITDVQVYASTTDAVKVSMSALKKIETSTYIAYISGDFNANVGSQAETRHTGSFGLGEKNNAGDYLVQFCH